jgi:hypothetical protein
MAKPQFSLRKMRRQARVPDRIRDRAGMAGLANLLAGHPDEQPARLDHDHQLAGGPHDLAVEFP